MPALDWDSRVGRRLRLRDLHILFAVVEHGSMSAAGPPQYVAIGRLAGHRGA
jgi:hypothetical protein